MKHLVVACWLRFSLSWVRKHYCSIHVLQASSALASSLSPLFFPVQALECDYSALLEAHIASLVRGSDRDPHVYVAWGCVETDYAYLGKLCLPLFVHSAVEMDCACLKLGNGYEVEKDYVWDLQ